MSHENRADVPLPGRTASTASSPQDVAALASSRVRAVCLTGIAVAMLAGCTSLRQHSEQVSSQSPEVTYEYSTDNGLLEASAKARDYCAQYATTPSMVGSITRNPDGSNNVTFVCVRSGFAPTDQTVQVFPAPPSPPRGYVYSTDSQLLGAIQSADAYCNRSGQASATSITTNSDGTKSLTFQCVPI
jgi:hypothetical protein